MGNWESVQIFTGTVTGAHTGTPVLDVRDAIACSILLKITALSGTSPSLTVFLQGSDNGTDWYDIQSSSAITAAPAANQYPIINVTSLNVKLVRIRGTLTGTTPSATYTAFFSGRM